MADFYLAPLRGITDGIFRSAYERRFGRFDRVVAPFIPMVMGNQVKDHHVKDLLSDKGNGRLIPQIIGRESAGFLPLAHKFADMGFASVNWNLGCPAPLVAKKARGCGLLPHKDAIKQFLDEATPKLPIPLSIKARLGYESPDDLEALLPLFNDYPVKELMIHPRTGIQLYDAPVDLDRFEACLNLSKHPVVYNGDIVSVSAFKQLTDRFPNVNGWMIGRGIVMNPFLLDELKKHVDGTGSTESSAPTAPTRRSQIIGFLSDLVDACKDTHPINVLGRMKEIWKYLGRGINGWEELSEKIIRCKSLQEYRGIIDTVT